jgi:hypothetical protein
MTEKWVFLTISAFLILFSTTASLCSADQFGSSDFSVEYNLLITILNPPNPLFQRGNNSLIPFNKNGSFSPFSKGGKRDLRCLQDSSPHFSLKNPQSYKLLLTSDEKSDSNPIANSLSVTNQKSPAKAFLFSVTIPGTGELYTGSTKKGVAFIATEVAFWSAYVVLHGRSKDLNSGYKKYVKEHIAFEEDSPVKSVDGWNMEDYEHATQTGNWHYIYTEKDVERLGKFYWKDLPEDKLDEPGEDIMTKYRKEAYSKRGSANTKYKQAKRCLSLIVVNHIVSAIDARISAVLHNKQTSQTNTSISIYPFITPNNESGLYVTLNNGF